MPMRTVWTAVSTVLLAAGSLLANPPSLLVNVGNTNTPGAVTANGGGLDFTATHVVPQIEEAYRDCIAVARR